MPNKKKIVIFTSDPFGLKIYDFVNSKKEYETYLVVAKNNLLNDQIKMLNINIFEYYENLGKKKNLLKFKKYNFDLLISVYFNRIFKKKIFSSVKKTVNFHPSYLPHHKGCYPHVHSILSKIGGGISFHEIDQKVDSGQILYQKKIFPNLLDNQDSFHEKIKDEFLKEFKKKFKFILSGKLKSKIKYSKGNYNNKYSLEKYDRLFLNKSYKLKDLILLLNARKYQSNTFSYFKYKNKKIKIHMKLSKDGK